MTKHWIQKSAIILALVSISYVANSRTHSVSPVVGYRTGTYAGSIFGFHYDYQPIPFIGLTVIAEQTFSTPSMSMIGAGPAIYPIPMLGLKIYALPGLMMAGDGSYGFVRAGLAYNLGIGPVIFAPFAWVDAAKSHAPQYVGGLMVGLGI